MNVKCTKTYCSCYVFTLLRLCYEHGSELMHLDSVEMDNFTTSILDGLDSGIGNPALPGYYHLGIYQKQESKKYYLKSGQNV